MCSQVIIRRPTIFFRWIFRYSSGDNHDNHDGIRDSSGSGIDGDFGRRHSSDNHTGLSFRIPLACYDFWILLLLVQRQNTEIGKLFFFLPTFNCFGIYVTYVWRKYPDPHYVNWRNSVASLICTHIYSFRKLRFLITSMKAKRLLLTLPHLLDTRNHSCLTGMENLQQLFFFLDHTKTITISER